MKIILGSIFQLQAELAGGKSGSIEFKGLLNEPVTFKTKYNLQKLLKKVNAEIEEYRKALVDLYKENGAEEQDGNLILKEGDPAIEKVNKEVMDLLSAEVNFEVSFSIDDFDFNSESTYPVFMDSAFAND